MVKAKPSPVSSLIVQLLYLLHMPLMGAKPADTTIREKLFENLGYLKIQKQAR